MSAGAEARGTELRGRARSRAGVERNELLTSTAAAALTILLLAEGLTLLNMHGLLGAHMFIGLLLVPPVLLKLASTGYRFVRYYSGAPTYREKGPPRPLLRVLAPVLVASTAMIFVSGIWLLLLGHHSDQALTLHKVAFIVWSGVFAVHFLAYLPTAVRTLGGSVASSRARRRFAGSRVTAMLVLSSLAGGLALALTLLMRIRGWHGHGF